MRWKEYFKEYGFVAVDLMKSAQTNFGLLDLKDKAFERDLNDWFQRMEKKHMPGIFLIAVKESSLEGEGGGAIAVLHHVIILEESASPDIVGLDSLDVSMSFKGFKSSELFGKLTPHKGARKVGAADYFVPSVDGLTEGAHPIKGKFVPGAKDVCANIQALESKINGVFVPFPLAQLLLGEEVDIEESEDDEVAEPEKFNPRNPTDLLTRLVRVMAYKKKHDPEWYRDWKAIAQEVVAILWSVGNGFAPGIEILPATMNRKLIEHQMKCALELFKSDKELYGENEDEVEEVKESEERPATGEGEERPRGEGLEPDRTVGEAPGQDFASRSSPFSRGSSVRSPRPSPPRRERQNISFTISPTQRLGQEGEFKDSDPVDQEFEGGARGHPRAEAEEADAFPDFRVPGAPDWVERLAGQFLSGILATTKALSTAGTSMSELAEANKLSLEKKEEKKKAISKWLPSGVFLFRVLSAEDGWRTMGIPELNDFALKLVDQKIFGATQLLRAQKKALNWPGGLLKPGVGEFLKRGFVSEDVQVGPSGFSVLFFHPSCHADTDSEEFSIQQLNESFGDGKLPEEMMKTFSKLQIWVPQTVQDAEEQIDTAIQFLKSICGNSTIATGGYEAGFNQLKANRRLFRSRGTMFLLNYMYMLDRVFQAFCQELLKYESEEDPIQVSRLTGAQGWMAKLVEGPVQSWLVAGTVPLYSAPSAWDDRKFSDGLVDLHGSKGRAAGGGGGGPSSPVAKKRKVEKAAEESKEKSWHRALDPDEYVKEWFLPEGDGKNFFSYFSPSKPENYLGFPKVAHHRTGRPAHICLRYIIGNGPGCSRGISCLRSHVRMNDLSADEKGTITKQLKKVYGAGGKGE